MMSSIALMAEEEAVCEVVVGAVGDIGDPSSLRGCWLNCHVTKAWLQKAER
jgi:hypothetical protein